MYLIKQLKLNLREEKLQSVTHNELKVSIRSKHSVENPDLFDIDEQFKEHINEDNKNFELNLVKHDFKIVFDKDFYPHTKSDKQNPGFASSSHGEYKQSVLQLKRFFFILD